MGQLQQIQTRVLDPMFNQLLPHFDSPEVRVQMLATGLQETKFLTRRQYGDGPARGYWQAERSGSVLGVLTSSATRDYAAAVCQARNVAPSADSVWRKLEFDDLLAAAFARLTLWADPRPLPSLGRGREAWACYLRNWRPGHPRPAEWNGNYAQALEAVRA